jgi:hypothetical protein
MNIEIQLTMLKKKHKPSAFSLNIPLASNINCASKHISSDLNSKTTANMKN